MRHFLLAPAAIILFGCAFSPDTAADGDTALQEEPCPEQDVHDIPQEIGLLDIFRETYPTTSFTAKYDEDLRDWAVTVSTAGRSAELYWAEGKMLPKEEIQNATDYEPIIYEYPKEIPDPASFSEEYIEHIRQYSSPQNRAEAPGTPPFFFDVVYDCGTRASAERHLVRDTFLGKRLTIHVRIQDALRRVEKRLLARAQTDGEVRDFISQLLRIEAYSWRSIRDSKNRSFHSLGIAIDILPKNWGQKNVYWAWRRDIDPQNWMRLPLDRRWMPPPSVIEIFEDEGFIWGGKWIIWDNMHFEYHPELTMHSRQSR